jgi:hypothetical protein
MDVKSRRRRRQQLPSSKTPKGLQLGAAHHLLAHFVGGPSRPSTSDGLIGWNRHLPSIRCICYTLLPSYRPTSPPLSIIVYVTQERERSLFCRFLCCWRSGVTGIIQRRGPFIANSQRGRRDSRAFFWGGGGMRDAGEQLLYDDSITRSTHTK